MNPKIGWWCAPCFYICLLSFLCFCHAFHALTLSSCTLLLYFFIYSRSMSVLQYSWILNTKLSYAFLSNNKSPVRLSLVMRQFGPSTAPPCGLLDLSMLTLYVLSVATKPLGPMWHICGTSISNSSGCLHLLHRKRKFLLPQQAKPSIHHWWW